MKILSDIKYILETLIKRPSPKKITQVNFAITYLCNSQCKTCNIWKRYQKNPQKLKQELTLEEIKKMFTNSRYLKNLRTIGLIGGEPFLRKDFVELCGFLIKKYPQANISIPTNALNTDLILKKLTEIIKKYNPKNLSIWVSLDGLEKTHDEIRGMPGNYKNALEVIEKIKQNLPSINLGISFTITPKNYQDLLKIYEISQKQKIDFGCCFAQTSDYYYDNLEKQFKWNNKQLKEVEKTFKKIIENYRLDKKSFFQKFLKKATVNDATTYYFSNIVDFQKNKKRKISCYSGTHSFFLDPYGDVYPCIMSNRKIGNLREGFDKIWMSKETKKIRHLIKTKGCACFTPCEVSLSITKNLKVIFLNLFKTVVGRNFCIF
jgi:MoaA/NifB/PqqE/SkfB family radical SAM enzyme